jgi:uncharacterized repeat protein (TIGR04138 family)
MSTTGRTMLVRERYHPKAYDFVFQALRHSQQTLGKAGNEPSESEEAHISGQELLEGIRLLALSQFGLMTNTVFRHWGIFATDDFGRIVFEMIECGKMKKTDRDQLGDFLGVYDFEDVFDREYRVDARNVFRNSSLGT